MLTRIVIIGGGPAGYEAALVAAARGPEQVQVTVVDSDGMGGACVLWDCVPSKAFIASTGVRTELRRAAGLGYDIGIEDAPITLPQINRRALTLAVSQSVDIGTTLNVAFRVALDESYELLCRRHTLSVYRGFPRNTLPLLISGIVFAVSEPELSKPLRGLAMSRQRRRRCCPPFQR